MHELSIALGVVEAACEALDRVGDARVEAVRLRLGPLSGVVRESLLFSFDAAAAGTPIAGARLEIEDVPVVVWCAACDAPRRLAAPSSRRCPVCDGVAPDVLEGEEIELVGLEVADA